MLVYRIIVLSAAILIILLTVALTGQVPVIANMFDTRVAIYPNAIYSDKTSGVPVNGAVKLSSPIFEERLSRLDLEEASGVLVPITVGEAGVTALAGQATFQFSSEGYGSFTSRASGCGPYSPIVNLVTLNRSSGETSALFDRRVFLPAYGLLWLEDVTIIVVLVVEKDTNGDGLLSCDDEGHFELIKADTGERQKVGRTFLPYAVVFFGYANETEQLNLGEVAEDGLVRQFKLSVRNGQLTAIKTTDLLSKARAAFERTNP